MNKTFYIGSCADDSIGIGTQIIGSDYRPSQGDYRYEVLHNNTWIECYDVVLVSTTEEIRYVID